MKSLLQDYFDTGKEPRKRKLIKCINALETKIESLENTVKDELYKEFMAKLSEPQELVRLRKENKRLRLQVKELKEIIREGK